MISRDMSYPAGDLGIVFQHAASTRAGSGDSEKYRHSSVVSRTVASWILSLLMATWPEGAGTDKSRRARSTRNLIPP